MHGAGPAGAAGSTGRESVQLFGAGERSAQLGVCICLTGVRLGVPLCPGLREGRTWALRVAESWDSQGDQNERATVQRRCDMGRVRCPKVQGVAQ